VAIGRRQKHLYCTERADSNEVLNQAVMLADGEWIVLAGGEQGSRSLPILHTDGNSIQGGKNGAAVQHIGTVVKEPAECDMYMYSVQTQEHIMSLPVGWLTFLSL